MDSPSTPVKTSTWGRQRKLTDFGGLCCSTSLKKRAESQLEELDELQRKCSKSATKRPVSARKPPSSQKKKGRTVLCDTAGGAPLHQTVIDANQRVIGSRVCDVCHFVGDLDDEHDRKVHDQEHAEFLRRKADRPDILKFPKQLADVRALACEVRVKTGRISGAILPVTDRSAAALKVKAKECLRYAEEQMGSLHSHHLNRLGDLVLLFLSETNPRYITGCVSAERVMPEAVSTVTWEAPVADGTLPESRAATRTDCYCGIALMWVASGSRRKGVAREMLNCLRLHYNRWCHQHGSGIDLAFSEPTDAGRAFVRSFTGGKDWLLYEAQKEAVL